MKIINKLITVFGLISFLGLILIIISSTLKIQNTEFLFYGFIIMGGGLILCFFLYILLIIKSRTFLKKFILKYKSLDKTSFSIPDFRNNYGKINFLNISNLVSVDTNIFIFTNSYWNQIERGVTNTIQKEYNICFLITNISNDTGVFICKKSLASNLISKFIIPILTFRRDNSTQDNDFFYIKSDKDTSKLIEKLKNPLFQIKKLYGNKMGTALDSIPTPFDIRITEENVLFRTNYDNAVLLPDIIPVIKEIKDILQK